MKKIVIAVILVVMMLGIFMVCEADVPDISELTEEELLELRESVNARIDGSMNFMPFEPNGYKIGEDIPEGLYVVSFVKSTSSLECLLVITFPSDSEDEWEVYESLYEGDEFMCKLEEGMRLVVEDGTIHLERVG